MSSIRRSILQFGRSALASTLAASIVVANLPARSEAAASRRGREVRINPASLRRLLILNDISVLTALNLVAQAKAEVNVARGNLLPKISVTGAATGIATGGASFAATGISFLLPFLLPSNWFALSAAEHQMAATGYAYNLVELNEYASALAIYYTILSDIERLQYFENQLEALKTLRDLVAAKTRLGTATAIDLAQAQGAVESYKFNVANVRKLIGQETSAVRRMLSLPLETQIIFERVNQPPSSAENVAPQRLLDRVFPVSNEFYQVESMIKASEDVTWTKVFSFLGGASLSMQTSTAVPMSWRMLGGSAQATIGFDYFPQIELSQESTKALFLYKKMLRNLMASTIESTSVSLQAVKSQIESGTQAVAAYKTAYEGYLQNYQLGQVDLLHVLQALQDITAASVSLAGARGDLNEQRVNLYRVTVSDQFALIPMCRISGKETSGQLGIFSWFTDLFSMGGSTTEYTVDQLCRRPAR